MCNNKHTIVYESSDRIRKCGSSQNQGVTQIITDQRWIIYTCNVNKIQQVLGIIVQLIFMKYGQSVTTVRATKNSNRGDKKLLSKRKLPSKRSKLATSY